MKKTLGILITAAVLLSLSACSDKTETKAEQIETAAATYIDDGYDEDFFAFYDVVNLDFNDAVSDCYAVVTAKCNGLLLSDDDSRIYEFTLEDNIRGGEMSETFRVSMPKGSFSKEDGGVFTSNDMLYKTNGRYFLPLKKDISVFYDYDLYYPTAQIFAELDDSDNFVEATIQGRTLTEVNSVQSFADLAQKQRIVCSQSDEEIGTPFSRSDDISEIVSETEYILEVEISEVEYNGAGDRTTYKCNVTDSLKVSGSAPTNINAVLPKDSAEIGGKYLLLLNRCGEDSYVFVISSRNYSVYAADSEQAGEILALLK